MIKTALSLTSLLFFAQHALGVNEPPAGFLLDTQTVITSARAVTAARFPDADRVLVDDHVLEIYEANGTSVVWDDEYSKVLTEKGRRDGSTHEIQFDLHYGTSFVFRAEIIKPDGRVIPIDTAAYSRVMTESGQMGANIYDPSSKTLSFSMPGLEVGDLGHLVVCQITSTARMPDTWSDYSVFEYDLPIVRLEYAISAPAERPILHKVLRAPVTNTVAYAETRQADGRTLHVWKVANVPQMFPEPDMPPLHTQVQRLLLSTITDWRAVSRWYWQLCQPALSKTTPEMQARTDALVAGAASREEKLRRVFKFVSQEIRYMGINAEDVAPGYAPHEVSLTFNNRYGVCRDKAALLAAMLRLADIPAYPVLINASEKMDADVPFPYFNHAITAVDKPGGGYILLDPTDENTRDLFPAYLCNRSYLVARADGEMLLVSDVYPAEKNLTRISTEGSLDETGALLLKSKIVFEGINDNTYRGHFLRLKAEQRRKFFEALLKSRLSGAEVIECAITPEDLQDTETPLTVSLTSRVPDFPVRGDGLDLATMPWLGTSLGYVNFVIGQTGLKERRYTMETGITCGIEEQVRLNIAAGLGAVHTLPDDVRIDRAGVRFAMAQAVTNGVLTGKLSYVLKTPEFTPPDYLELKKILKEVESASRHRPLFVAKNTLVPDQEVLACETDTRIFTPHSWATTQTWTKRILTYAGKQKGAELKFNYNPVWQSLELVSATVSNANGAVHAVTPKEINIMDAAWAGAAPRYPAAKTLVVNLPGVETGSVITVTTRFTQTNACFYSQSFAFGGMEPVQSETYRFTYPKSLAPAIQMFHFEKVTCAAETNAASVVLTYHAARQPGIRSEEQLPPAHFFRPTLFVSLGDWQTHASRLRRAIEAVSNGDTATSRRAKALVKGIKDPRARILAIRDEVLRTIRPAGPSFLDLPLGCLSTPDRTLADQYGHPADRAILLDAMLNAAGFDAEILFASSDTTGYSACSQPMREVPQLGFYGNPLVAVHEKGITYYLNDGDQYDELGVSRFDTAPALTLRGKVTMLAVAQPFRDAGKNEMSIDLDARGTARVTVTNWFLGSAAGPFRKSYNEMLPEDRRRHHLELVGGVAKSAEAASDLVTETTAYPSYRTFAVTAANYAVAEGNTLTLLIPEVTGALFPLRADTRENPLFLGVTDTSERVCRITLPPGYTRLPLLPEPKSWMLPCGFGSLEYTVTATTRPDARREVCITRTLKRASGEASPELYPALLEYNRRFTHPSMRTLVAERPATP
jgi:transglutaminase-like putative cysteine protease